MRLVEKYGVEGFKEAVTKEVESYDRGVTVEALDGSRFGWVGEDVEWEEIGGSPLARRNRNSGSVFSGSWKRLTIGGRYNKII